MLSCMPFVRHVEYVDKRQCNLNDIPEDIIRYARTLEELLLDSNHIRELSKHLFRFHKLKHLALSDNEITKVPSDISQLANLVELDLSKNEISDISENIKQCKSLVYFNISDNPLLNFPSCISQLVTLVHLGLNDASLAELPDEIGHLVNLQVLELRNNMLSEFPSTFSSLTKLKVLDLGTNELDQLPPEIVALSNLTELYLDGNSLEILPRGISKLQQLSSLDIAENKLLRVPDEIGDLKNLTDLTLSQNCLESLPYSIGKLKKLNILKLDRNRLLEITPAICSCISLNELILTENVLSELPATIGNLKELTVLNADKNRITELPDTIGCCLNLTVLSLRENLLTKLVDEIGKLDKLSVLDVSGNRLQYLPYTLNALQQLNALWLSDNQSQPMLRLQADQDQRTGIKVLTCYLLPQQDIRIDDFSARDLSTNGQPVTQASFTGGPKVHFPDADQDDDEDEEQRQSSLIGKFQRHDTPHPKHGVKPKANNGDGVGMQVTCDKGLTNTAFRYGPNDGSKEALLHNDNIGMELSTGQSNQSPEKISSSALNSSCQTGACYDSVDKSSSVFLNHKGDSQLSEDALKMQGKVAEILAKQQKLGRISRSNETLSVQQQMQQQQQSGLPINYQLIEAIIEKDANGLGLSVAGGAGSPPFKDDDPSIFVSKVAENGAAHRAGLRYGDKLLQINNNDVSTSSHKHCVTLMLEATARHPTTNIVPPLRLKVLREIPVPSHEVQRIGHSSDETPSMLPTSAFHSSANEETLAVSLRRRPGEGFGFSIATMSLLGVGSEHRNVDFLTQTRANTAIVVSKIVDNGVADVDGRLRVDDWIVSINGINVCDTRDDNVASLMTNSGDEVHLVVKRNSVLKSVVGSAPFPKYVDSSPNKAKCFSTVDNMDEPFSIEEVRLVKGDGPLGLSIVGGTDNTGHPFCVDNSAGVFVSKVVPGGVAHQTGRIRIGDRLLKVNGIDISDMTHNETVAALMTPSAEAVLLLRHDPPPKGLKEISIAISNFEQLGVEIHGGLGTAAYSSDPADEGIFVQKILPNSPAAKEGRLKVGDRLLEANNRSLLGVSKIEALNYLKAVHPSSIIQLTVCDGPSQLFVSQEDGAGFKESCIPVLAHRSTSISEAQNAFIQQSSATLKDLKFKNASATCLIENHDTSSSAKRLIGLPVPKPYVSKPLSSAPPKPIPLSSSKPGSLAASSSSLHHLHGDITSKVNDFNADSSDKSLRIISAIAPPIPPKPISRLNKDTPPSSASELISRSRIPTAARPKNSTPLTPTGNSEPETLPFTRKLQKFEQEIDQKTTDAKKIGLRSSPNAFENMSNSYVVDNFETNNQSTSSSDHRIAPIQPNVSTSSIPTVVRTKKAENRMMKAVQNDSSDNEHRSDKSPLEIHALESAKRSQWRKARMVSLERDALKAEKVMSQGARKDVGQKFLDTQALEENGNSFLSNSFISYDNSNCSNSFLMHANVDDPSLIAFNGSMIHSEPLLHSQEINDSKVDEPKLPGNSSINDLKI